MRLVRALLTALLPLALASAVCPGCTRTDPEPLPGARLGMSPRDVRDRFQPGGQGAWQTKLGAGDDTVLEWSAREPGTRVESARFEFHLGMLVAVRARLREGAAGERIERTPKTVTAWRPAAPGESEVTVLARDCPTHHEEAEALVSRAR